jgi:hypothetical protein
MHRKQIKTQKNAKGISIESLRVNLDNRFDQIHFYVLLPPVKFL